MNTLNLDASLAAVVDALRETHGPIWQAIENRQQITATDCAILSGVVQALLKAIDARLPETEQAVA